MAVAALIATLTVNGLAFEGWKSVRVNRAIDQVAGTFELGVSERWPDQETPRKIAPGDRCTLALAGATIITGYVDEVSVSYAGDTHEVAVSGRDVTADLVDCSIAGGHYTKRSFLSIAQAICKPFGIEVVDKANAGLVDDVRVEYGETAFEALERIARLRSVLLVSDGAGRLVITRAGQERFTTPLVRGRNTLSAQGRLDFRDRYSSYRCVADPKDGASGTGPHADCLDPSITRHRPLIVRADDDAKPSTLKSRALWERNTRAGKSVELTVKTQGWLNGDGALWRPNYLVHVVDDWIGVDRDLIIRSVAFSLDENGTTTELGLTAPETFSVDGVPIKAKKPKKADKADNWSLL